MTNTEKRIKNQKIKETIKHILHVVCYVLSVAFIILMAIVGAQSCQKTSSQSAETLTSHQRNAINVNADDYYVYYLRTFPSSITLDLETQYLLCDGTVDVYEEYRVNHGTFDYDLNDVHGFVFKDGNYLRLDKITLKYRSYNYVNEHDISVYCYRLYRMNFLIDYGYPDAHNWGTSYLFTKHTESNVNDLIYDFSSSDLRIVLNEEEINSYGFNYFFARASKQDFIFNDNFNYNAPSMLPIGNQLWKDDNVKDTFEQDFYSDLQVGWFYSNGMFFDTIRYVYQNSNSMKFSTSKDTSWNNAMSGANGYAFYKELRYYNSFTNASWVVNTRDLYWIESGLGVPAYIYLNTTTWRDKGFTKITLLTELSDSNRVLLGSFNNNDLNSVITGFQNNGYNGDIFSLLSSAFTSILPVLNIMVLPNITIGILMFVPLVAMLVFAIIRIIKK